MEFVNKLKKIQSIEKINIIAEKSTLVTKTQFTQLIELMEMK